MPLLTEGLASPVDLRTTWTLEDVLDALEALAVANENERRAHKAAEQKGGR